MKRKNWIKRSLKVLLLSSILLSAQAVLAAESAEEVSGETCLECHDDMGETLSQTQHQLENNKTNISCSSCHTGGAEHIEDPSPENIGNPATTTSDKAITACMTCHTPHSDLDNYGFDMHQSQNLNCSSCHKVHGENKSLLLDNQTSFCLPCHSETKTKFAKRSNHPVKQGILTCLSCHQFTKKQDDNLAYDLDRSCQDCHPQQGGPFLFEHDATTGYAINGEGCITCHDPHGSENDRLLKQKGNDLCKQCHVEHVTRNHASQWDVNWSKLPCQSCHVDSHGSFTSHNYLDPNLEAKFGGNCFNSGCHSSSN